MIDFLSATKYKCKDSLFLGHCKLMCAYESGLVQYALEGCERMKIWHNPQADWMKVEGSLPYFLQGHNFTFSTRALVEAVDEIDALLGGVGLWGALVNQFEFGAIVPVEGKPKEYISRHTATSGSHLQRVLNDKYAGKFAMWRKPGLLDLKIYDAGANILLKQGLVRREVIESAGWNPEGNYIKCEVRFNKPEALNMGRGVQVEKMQNQSFLNMLKGELVEEYHLLAPARALVPATDKKDLSTLDIVVRTFAEVGGLSLDQAKKQIYRTINQAGCLSKADKDSRKAQIRKAVAKVEEAPESPWDLSARLEEALDRRIITTRQKCLKIKEKVAKKRTYKNSEEAAFQEVMKKAQAYVEASQRREESRRILQFGKEFAMLLTWMQQRGIAPAIDADKAKVALASSSSLKAHPKELKKVLAYYDSLQGYKVHHNLISIEPGRSDEEGKFWVHFSWQTLELPKEEGGTPPPPGEGGEE